MSTKVKQDIQVKLQSVPWAETLTHEQQLMSTAYVF